MSATGTVVIAAGGTGGHIYPALAVARVLETRKVPVVWIGTRDGLESRIVPDANIDIRFINISGLRGAGIKGLLTGPFKLIRASMQSIRILSDVGANSVLGMGGFVSGPVGIAAIVTRRMLVLHEQNAIAGMTNKWLGRLATRVYSAVPNVFPKKVGALAIGNPVRNSIEAVGKEKIAAQVSEDSAPAALRVLIVGGSRGARALNETVPAGLHALTQAAPELELHVWHQTGPADEPTVNQAYAAHSEDTKAHSDNSIKVSAYIEDMTAAYRWADVIICRSGAMTVSELSAAALPGVLIPYPHHSDNQQTLNAKFLCDAGAAILLPQNDLTAISLSTTLLSLVASSDVLPTMSIAAQGLHNPDAAVVVADALQEANN